MSETDQWPRSDDALSRSALAEIRAGNMHAEEAMDQEEERTAEAPTEEE